MNRVILSRITQRGVSQVACTKPSAAEVPIQIPKRIPRGPTDILRALAGTLKTDYTAPKYKYCDDPYLIPTSNSAKRTYSLAKESGKKAARYILENYPRHFKHDPAVPQIPAFNPGKTFTENQECNEDDLLFCINNFRVQDSITVYKNIEAKGGSISQESLQQLLQLLSFYNGREQLNEDLHEERWFRQTETAVRKTWSDAGLAESIFEKIQDKNADVYSSLIQGMAKHFQIDRSYELFEKMREKGMTPSVNVYNYLIPCVLFRSGAYDGRWGLVMDLLQDMKKAGVKPTLLTFNNILYVCSRLGSTSEGKKHALETIAEMRFVGIRPSLATYSLLMNTFCKNNAYVSQILPEIMDILEKSPIEPLEVRDTLFFMTAMDVCNEHLMNKELAYRVNDLLEKNKNMIGNAFRETIYYQNFFKLLCAVESVENFMHWYNKSVPTLYTPEPTLLSELISVIDLNKAYHYLPQVWSDIIGFGHATRENVLTQLLCALVRFPFAAPNSEQSDEQAELQTRILVIARDVRNRLFESEKPGKTNFPRPAQIIKSEHVSDLLQIFLNAHQLKDASAVVDTLIKEQQKITGFPTVEPLREYTIKACEEGLYSQALVCAKYCCELGYQDVIDRLTKDSEKLRLPQNVIQKLDDLSSKILEE